MYLIIGVFILRYYIKKHWQISYRNDFPFLPFKDKCEEREEEVILVSSAHEIDARSCPLILSEHKGPIIWYKNDGKTPVSTERDSRIHQHKDKLWFVPAEVEDSGYYYCAVR